MVNRLTEEIRCDLIEHYPTLHVFENTDGLLEVSGSFPVRGAGDGVLDYFDIKIILPKNFPVDLPSIREMGGRIPPTPERHIEPDGKACVIFPDDRWRCFPNGSTLVDYLNVPVRNFFLSQCYWEEHNEWPFGEWGHGIDGVLDYYKYLVETDDDITACRFLYVLSKSGLKRHWECPCGSGRKIKSCCFKRITDFRRKIPMNAAHKSLDMIKPNFKLYDGPKLRKRKDEKS